MSRGHQEKRGGQELEALLKSALLMIAHGDGSEVSPTLTGQGQIDASSVGQIPHQT